MLATLLQLIGIGSLIAAAFIMSVTLGLLVTGVALLVIGHAADGLSVQLFAKAPKE